MASDTIEKRFFFRLATSLPVRFRILGKETSGEYAGQCSNLSAGGMLMTCDPVDARTLDELVGARRHLLVRVRLGEGDDWVESRARVIWSEGEHRLGVRFEDLPAAEQRRVQDFVLAHYASQRDASLT
jgi:c-di-GMP-binding flagellar brake protein YcgR